MPLFSIIIAVYNRPDELKELLESLVKIEKEDFEVIVVEDGSENSAETVAKQFNSALNLTYLTKNNTGQGFSRNFAAEQAKGKYLVFFDSDCLVPPQYFKEVEKALSEKEFRFWGGPDASHPSFTYLQKAISYTMTSIFTTGGIRGGKNQAKKFQPRSFNMGIEKDLFLENKGFHQTNLGEDIELSTRLINQGVKPALLEKAFVYHKRRNTLESFFKQAQSFGRGRILTGRKNKEGIKLIHWFPTLFTTGLILGMLLSYISPYTGKNIMRLYGLYSMMIFFGGLIKEKNIIVALTSVIAAYIQLIGYGYGFFKEWLNNKIT